MKLILLVLLLGTVLEKVSCDLPVHCLAKSIQGDWIFSLTEANEKSLPNCGHMAPDRNTDHIEQNFKNQITIKDTLKVGLALPDKVFDDKGGFFGRWTMVYDEGFEIQTEKHVFFAFSSYTTVNNKIPSDTDDEQTAGYKSICGETFLGWYRTIDLSSFGCFYGVKFDMQGVTSDHSTIFANSKNKEKIVERRDLMTSSNNQNAEQKIKEQYVTGPSPTVNSLPTPSLVVVSQSSSVDTQSGPSLNTLNSEMGLKYADGPLPEKEGQANNNNNYESSYSSLNFLQRFKQNLPVYEIPHSDLLDLTEEVRTDFGDDMSFIEKTNKLEDKNEWKFEPDYNFIELINSISLNSPWKAKAHDIFKGKSERHMKNLIGLTRFKEKKIAQLKERIIINSKLRTNASKEDENIRDMEFLQIQSVSKLSLKSRKTSKGNGEFLPKFDEGSNSFSEDEPKNGPHTLGDSVFSSINANYKFLDTSKDGAFDQKNGAFDPTNVCQEKNELGLPRCFDWRSKDGINYDTPIKKQGDCGSCYALATLSAFEARVRIKSKNNLQPFLSISGVVSCSSFNQGCNGGYPYLVAKFGAEKGFFEESCSPYSETDKICQEQCFSSKRIWKVKEYGYVGKKYYGSTNEEAMIKEIWEKGPVVVAINAAPDLYYYSSGVFVSNPNNPLIESNDHPEIRPWQFTNHAVTCIGWGETLHDGHILKYWILKNSWGDDWGEGGYFKMLRGVNLGAVENQAVFADPDIGVNKE